MLYLHSTPVEAAPILTPSEFAARQLRAATNATTEALSLNQWLSAQWSTLVTRGAESRLLLNPGQEHLLWGQAIQAGPEFESMGTLDALATLAAAAWARAAAHHLTPEALRRAAATADAATHDTRLFAAWAVAFRNLCATHGYLSAAELPAALREHTEAGTLHLPSALRLLAMPDLTPAQTAFFDALGERGCNITHIPFAQPPNPAAEQTVVSAADSRHEALTAIRWIRSFVARRAAAGQPHRVALLVPTLGEERSALDATLREILAPELQAITADPIAAPHAFLEGPPLAASSMVAAAMDLLGWAAEPLPLETVSALLLSPCFGASADLAARAEFDAFTLRTAPLLRPELDPAALLSIAASRSSRHPVAPAVLALLRAWNAAVHHLATSKARSYADWTDTFRRALRDATWPGERPLTAADFAVTRAWDHALDAVATLDFAGIRVDFGTALAALTRQVQQATVAVPETDAPISIMTPADVAGCTFDAVVFLRATDTNWPVPDRANPLLPWSLQRDRRMPGTDPGLAAARATRLTASLVASAPAFLACYARETADGVQRLAPTIAQLGLPTLPAEKFLPLPAETAPLPEEIVEDTAPLPPLPPGPLRGGATVLELQAACAFHAFAALRLNGSAPETRRDGFDARELGNFLHKTLDIFWSTVRTQAALRAKSLSERRAALVDAIEQAAARQPAAQNTWDAAYLALQKTRMADVLMQWLEHELKRGPFEVREREQARELAVGPLTLQVRLDRVDAVDGGTLLVDYKTGRSGTPADWIGERPAAPQLPLYALLPDADELQGLAFAKIRPGKDMKWHGHGPQGVLPRSTPAPYADIAAQRDEWRATLEALAADFFAGKADVSPKDYPATCTHCAHRLLCRIHSAALAADHAETPQDADATDWGASDA